MFVCCECCVLSGRGLCDEPITRPEESYRLWCVVVCDQKPRKWRGHDPCWVAAPQKKKTDYSTICVVLFQPAHVKACFLGSSLTIPITDGKLNLGTWQGIWLCEHRNHAGSRKVVITVNGCLRDSSRSPLSPVSPMASTSS